MTAEFAEIFKGPVGNTQELTLYCEHLERKLTPPNFVLSNRRLMFLVHELHVSYLSFTRQLYSASARVLMRLH